MRKYRKWLGQFLPREFFRCLAYLDGLGHSDRKVFRLFYQARRIQFVRFSGIDQIEAKDVFLAADAGMETISVVGGIHNEMAILQNDPVFRSIARAKVNYRRPNNDNCNERNSGKSRRNQRARDQTGTSNWLISLNVS